MKILKTSSFNKLSKEWDPNPWAVCHTTVDKDKNPDKYERCVQDVKKKDSKPNKDYTELRSPYSAAEDFKKKMKDEKSGYNAKKEDDAMSDKWDQLFNKDKKRQPAFASKKDKKKKEPEMIKPFKR